MLQQSKGQEQRAVKASFCALTAVVGAQQLIEQVFGVEGVEKFMSMVQQISSLDDIPENLTLKGSSSYERAIIEFGFYNHNDTLGLDEYPIAIAKLESKLFEASCSLEKIQLNLKSIESEIDSEVVFDSALRNEQQRKATKSQKLEQHEYYWELSDKLEQARAKHQAILIELGLRRNQFSLLKLELQKQIATLQLQNN